MRSWLEIEKFSKTVGLDVSRVQAMIQEGKLFSKRENDIWYVEVGESVNALIPVVQKEVFGEVVDERLVAVNPAFIEKTVGTIVRLHEKVLDAKDETLDALRSENRFLKEALFSMQELYDEDRKSIETLTKQLEYMKDELEFTKRKDKRMLNEAVEGYTLPAK